MGLSVRLDTCFQRQSDFSGRILLFTFFTEAAKNDGSKHLLEYIDILIKVTEEDILSKLKPSAQRFCNEERK
jgi:hypothetical protein